MLNIKPDSLLVIKIRAALLGLACAIFASLACGVQSEQAADRVPSDSPEVVTTDSQAAEPPSGMQLEITVESLPSDATLETRVDEPVAQVIESVPVAGAAPTLAPPPLVVVVATAVSGDPAGEVLSLLNQYRLGHGLPALTSNASLSAAAAGYARYMAEANFVSHYGLNGSSPASRMAAAGYPGRYCSGCGEALNGGQRSAQESLNAWLNSPPHAAIVLSAAAIDVGVGYAFAPGSAYGHYWVLITGLP